MKASMQEEAHSGMCHGTGSPSTIMSHEPPPSVRAARLQNEVVTKDCLSCEFSHEKCSENAPQFSLNFQTFISWVRTNPATSPPNFLKISMQQKTKTTDKLLGMRRDKLLLVFLQDQFPAPALRTWFLNARPNDLCNRQTFHWEIKGRFRKRVVLVNVPPFRFSFQGNMRTYPRSGFCSGGSFRRGDFGPREPELGVEFWDATF